EPLRSWKRAGIWVAVRCLVRNFINDRVFVDTNVLIYAYDRAASAKHDQAGLIVRSLFDKANGCISTQVLQEFCVKVSRADRTFTLQKLREWVVIFLHWHVVVNNADSVITALQLEERYQISFWDALIVQAAQVSGAELLYSEDLNHGQWYGSVRVVNPFL